MIFKYYTAFVKYFILAYAQLAIQTHFPVYLQFTKSKLIASRPYTDKAEDTRKPAEHVRYKYVTTVSWNQQQKIASRLTRKTVVYKYLSRFSDKMNYPCKKYSEYYITENNAKVTYCGFQKPPAEAILKNARSPGLLGSLGTRIYVREGEELIQGPHPYCHSIRIMWLFIWEVKQFFSYILSYT